MFNVMHQRTRSDSNYFTVADDIKKDDTLLYIQKKK